MLPPVNPAEWSPHKNFGSTNGFLMERATGVEPATSSLGARRTDFRGILATIACLQRSARTQPVGIFPLSCHRFPPIVRRLWVFLG
jgi:hypothetical protein